MSDKVEGSGDTDGEEDRKGKRIKYSDDDQKQPGGQNPSSVPPELSHEDLTIFNIISENDGTNLDDLMKKQQLAFKQLNRVNNPLQQSAEGESSQEDSDTDAQIEGYFNDSSDSDTKKDDLGPVEELIFELEISDRNRLVIPYAMASFHFPPMVMHPNSEETLNLYDLLGREWTMTLIYDSTANAYVITNGFNDYLKHHRVNKADIIRVYLPVPQPKIRDFYIQHQKKLGVSRFEVKVPRSNRLCIPYKRAEKYFSPTEAPRPPYQLKEFPFYLTDYLNLTWEMKFVCYNDEEAYVVVRGWEQYAAHHHLAHNDTLRFYKHKPNPGKNRFIVYHELKRRVGGSLPLGEIKHTLFPEKNRFFDMRLTEWDVTFGRLEMPGINLPSDFRDQEMVKLTDVNNKKWYVIFVKSSWRDWIMFDGWEGIVAEHNLEVGDRVRLYDSLDADQDTHILIEFVKKKKEQEEGGSGLGKPDDGAGPSCKGKEVAE